ncbi:MAG: polymerase III subunit beta protein [Candidatus Magasanikbacteria bacterium GW2011_GWC2_37_14]|uniref:Beta sliding clamp n=1 Tax=Candidatus Magasanikbacteria bacterium GW2011_GWC2_37_14 TaxID=1619046 RepID=A0A0G0G8W1_9BACT|nr:MAG: polymerase III subunit beta protein [Candidatus Magasanikbacteria bacterium GW2011_GWC2_37_14]
MKYTCIKENLEKALDLVSGTAGKQVNLPILLNILIQAEESGVKLISTNLEMAVKVQVRAKVEKTGSFTVPAKTLTDFVHLLPEEQVEMELIESELVIRCGSSSTKIKGMSADEFPVVPEVEEKHGYVLKVNDLKQAMSQTVFACAKNEVRPELAGVFVGLFTERFKGLIMATTDSYRLAEKKVPVEQGEDEIKVIVPSRTVHEIIRLLALAKEEQGESNVRLWISENQIAIRYDSFELTSRLVSGRYPDYTQIIPTSFKTTALFSISAMTKKIKAASLFTTMGVNAVSFDLNSSENSIAISSTSTQTGEHASEMDVEISGEENSILLNHRYVLDGLQNLGSEEAEFKMNGADSPCLFKAKGNEDYLYIVMPIRQ